MMEQQPDQSKPSGEPGVGFLLKQAREAAGVSLADVAARLKLSMRQLEAIEADDFQSLPGPIFVRGFVRNYARFLALDSEPLMRRLEQQMPVAAQETVADVPQPARGQELSGKGPRAAPLAWGRPLAVLSLVLVMIGVAWWLLSREHVDSAETAPGQLAPMLVHQEAASASLGTSAAASAPAKTAHMEASAASTVPSSGISKSQASAAVASTPPDAAGKISLKVGSGAAWISVVDANGKKLVFETVAAGSGREVSGTPPFQLKIGNAAQVQLAYNGQPVNFSDKIRGTTARIELK